MKSITAKTSTVAPPVRSRCADCKHFHVPSAEPQWRYIGSRVGECLAVTFGSMRPGTGRMSSVVDNPKRSGWFVAGGGILVDAEFGCVNFVQSEPL